MAGSTAKMVIPYPTSTDKVTDGDNAMQALAERVDAIALFRLNGPAGTAIQYGSQVVTTDANGGAFITYPTAFSAVPVVFLSGGDQSPQGVILEIVANPAYTGATQFLVVIRNITTHNPAASGNYRVNWLAIGPK